MRHRLTFIAAAATAALALAAGTAQAADKTVMLKLSSWVPAQHPLNPSLQAWADDIKKASGGTITATLFPSEQLGKAFDHSAPIGTIVPAAEAGDVGQAAITLTVNGETRQAATIADMTWNVAEIITELSRLVTLAPGDLIFTGTPAGVGPVVRGDRLEGHVGGVGSVSVRIA